MIFPRSTSIAVVALVCAAAPPVFAQTNSPTTVDRVDVKSQARAAEQQGTLPHGDLPIAGTTPSGGTPVDRSTLKKQTTDYNKAKVPSWSPGNGSYNQGNSTKSTATRAAVKADAKAAERNQTIPHGDATPPGAMQ